MTADPTNTPAPSEAKHYYHPSAMHMGDCSVCGNVEDSLCHIDPRKPSEAITQPSVEPDRGAIRALWKKHGGSWHGPRVETYTIPETSGFWPFIRELLASPSSEVERLTRELERLKKELGACEKMQLPEATVAAIKGHMNCMQAFDDVNALRLAAEATNRSLEERLAEERSETVKVLEPFAKEAADCDVYNREWPRAHPSSYRRARALLTKLKEVSRA